MFLPHYDTILYIAVIIIFHLGITQIFLKNYFQFYPSGKALVIKTNAFTIIINLNSFSRTQILIDREIEVFERAIYLRSLFSFLFLLLNCSCFFSFFFFPSNQLQFFLLFFFSSGFFPSIFLCPFCVSFVSKGRILLLPSFFPAVPAIVYSGSNHAMNDM